MLDTHRWRVISCLVLTSFLTLLMGSVKRVQADVTKRGSASQRKNPHIDLGVDTARVKTQTALFVDPDIASAKIATLSLSDLMVLVSREKLNGWYQVIQFSSGRQGWVRANRLFEPDYTKHRNPDKTLNGVSTGANDPPVMEVRNDTNYDLYLHIDKLAEVSVGPHATKSLAVQAGIFSFNAAASNLLPDFGHMAFLNGMIYSWSFFVRSVHTQKKQIIVTPQMIADYNIKLADVNAKRAEAKIEKQLIDDTRDTLDKQGDKAKVEADDIDGKRAALDHSDGKAVDDFNLLVISANNDLDSYKKMREEFNAKVIAYNSYLDALDAEQRQLDALEKAVNSSR